MKTGRLLVIDDDPRHCISLTGLVEDAGHRVMGTGEGEDAIRLLDDGADVDLILLDLKMPGVDGFDVLARVRTLDHPPAVIVLTAQRSEDQLRRLLRYGAEDCLRKPYEPDDLLASIHETLERRSRTEATDEMLQRLRASDLLHRFLVEQSPDVIYTLDPEGRFTFLSASSEQVFGRPPEELVGEHWTRLFAPGEQDLAHRRFNERRTGDRAARNFDLRLADGTFETPRWVQVSATGLYRHGDSGPDARTETDYEGTYGIVRDVTALREQQDARGHLEAQLEQARRMEAIGQLAGGIAHDFNNILASMIGFAELAQLSTDPRSGPTSGYLDEVVNAGRRARDLIAQLLNLSRPDEGSPRPVRLDTEVDDVTHMLRALLPTSVRIERDITETPVSVQIDPVQLQQVVLNLFINARDAVNGSGVIRVRVRHVDDLPPITCTACGESISGNLVELEIADDGAVIPDELRRHLFDPMVTARAEGRGTGFGLTLVQQIVHRHGGHLHVESDRVLGTAFRIHFRPVAARVESAPAQEGAAPPPRSAQRHHVVIVDDEVSVANFLRELLEHSGYDTTVFNDAETALAFLRERAAEVHLVITDQTMPRLSGTEFARRIAEFPAPPPVILCTGYGHDPATTDPADIRAVLAKPFQIPELLREVARHL